MSDGLLPCPRCYPTSCLEVRTDRDDTYVTCNDCGLRMSKHMWQEPRPRELFWCKRVMDLERKRRKRSKELKSLPGFHDLSLRVAELECRIESLEIASQKRGPSRSNPIPGAWPSMPAPVCAVCCGPHRTGDCAR